MFEADSFWSFGSALSSPPYRGDSIFSKTAFSPLFGDAKSEARRILSTAVKTMIMNVMDNLFTFPILIKNIPVDVSAKSSTKLF